MGYQAASHAVAGAVAEGNVGAGAGAGVGKIHGILCAMRGGVGSASVTLGDVVARAIVSGVRAATALPNLPAACDFGGEP